MKKHVFLGLGTITSIITPIVTVISCSGDTDDNKIIVNKAEEDAKLLQSQIIWSKSVNEIEELFNGVKVGDDVTSKLITSDENGNNLFQPIFVKGEKVGDEATLVTYKFKSWNKSNNKSADKVIVTAIIKNKKQTSEKDITINKMEDDQDEYTNEERIEKFKLLIKGDIFRFNNAYFVGSTPFPTAEKDSAIPDSFFDDFTHNNEVTSYKANKLLEGYVPEENKIKLLNKYEAIKIPEGKKYIDLKIPVYIEIPRAEDILNKNTNPDQVKHTFNLNIRIKS